MMDRVRKRMTLVVEGAGGMLAEAPVLLGVTLTNIVVVEEEGELETLTRDKIKVGRGCSSLKGRRYLTEQLFICLRGVYWRHTSTLLMVLFMPLSFDTLGVALGHYCLFHVSLRSHDFTQLHFC